MNSDIQQKLEDIEELFIENLAENMRSYGIPVTVGRVLGVIYMNRAPMTLDELSTETGMSKTRMSQVVREMVDYNIANKVYEKGIRKDLYAVEEDFTRSLSLFLHLVGKKSFTKTNEWGGKFIMNYWN